MQRRYLDQLNDCSEVTSVSDLLRLSKCGKKFCSTDCQLGCQVDKTLDLRGSISLANWVDLFSGKYIK
jgi:hypothetical protein